MPDMQELDERNLVKRVEIKWASINKAGQVTNIDWDDGWCNGEAEQTKEDRRIHLRKHGDFYRIVRVVRRHNGDVICREDLPGAIDMIKRLASE